MFFWWGIYKHKGKTYVLYGLFKYLEVKDAEFEFELLHDMKAYKFFKGVPMNAKCIRGRVFSPIQ